MNNEKEYYGEIVTEKEENIARNSNKKVLVIVMRCLFGSLGIDKFVMRKKRKGFMALLFTAALLFLNILGLLFLLIPFFGWLIYICFIALLWIFIVGRCIFFIVTGLRMIGYDAREIANIYEDL